MNMHEIIVLGTGRDNVGDFSVMKSAVGSGLVKVYETPQMPVPNHETPPYARLMSIQNPTKFGIPALKGFLYICSK
ncbi:MAG: hypothetical protein Q7S14_02785 [bacterium]|nr:hypothetical protein [bacterium]